MSGYSYILNNDLGDEVNDHIKDHVFSSDFIDKFNNENNTSLVACDGYVTSNELGDLDVISNYLHDTFYDRNN